MEKETMWKRLLLEAIGRRTDRNSRGNWHGKALGLRWEWFGSPYPSIWPPRCSPSNHVYVGRLTVYL